MRPYSQVEYPAFDGEYMVELHKVLEGLRSMYGEGVWSDLNDQDLLLLLDNISKKIDDMNWLMDELISPHFNKARYPEWTRVLRILKLFQDSNKEQVDDSRKVLENLRSVIIGHDYADEAEAIEPAIKECCVKTLELARKEERKLSQELATCGIPRLMDVAHIAEAARTMLLLVSGGMVKLYGSLLRASDDELVDLLEKMARLVNYLKLDIRQMDADRRPQNRSTAVHTRRRSRDSQDLALLLENDKFHYRRVPSVSDELVDVEHDVGGGLGLRPTARLPSLEERRPWSGPPDGNGQLLSPDPHTSRYAAREFRGSRSSTPLPRGGGARSLDTTDALEDSSSDDSYDSRCDEEKDRQFRVRKMVDAGWHVIGPNGPYTSRRSNPPWAPGGATPDDRRSYPSVPMRSNGGRSFGRASTQYNNGGSYSRVEE